MSAGPWELLDVLGNPPPLDHFLAETARQAREAAEAGDRSGLEVLQRQCQSILGFTEFRFPRYRPGRHHHLVAEQLERVERGEIDRLMLELPPRHGKSVSCARSCPQVSTNSSHT